MDADADLPPGRVQLGARVLAARGHDHEPRLGRGKHQGSRLSDRYHAWHRTPRMVDGDVQVAKDETRLDAELCDEEVVDAAAILLAQEQLRPDFGCVQSQYVHREVLAAVRNRGTLAAEKRGLAWL